MAQSSFTKWGTNGDDSGHNTKMYFSTLVKYMAEIGNGIMGAFRLAIGLLHQPRKAWRDFMDYR